MAPRILVADDDPASLALVARAIERTGCTVYRADDGDELLQAIAEHGPFDVIVTDVAMPWMTGLQVAQSARIAGDTTPVIVMTASRIPPREVDALGGKAVLLRKPFRVTQLISALRQMLPQQATRR
ncbi:MAG TPA: response regulator [Kofleriaceae bacterium]|nr:response regulator [Kofleriaceae bacterium]